MDTPGWAYGHEKENSQLVTEQLEFSPAEDSGAHLGHPVEQPHLRAKYKATRGREMGKWLRASPPLPEDLGSNPNT